MGWLSRQRGNQNRDSLACSARDIGIVPKQDLEVYEKINTELTALKNSRIPLGTSAVGWKHLNIFSYIKHRSPPSEPQQSGISKHIWEHHNKKK